jgi:hypothetical protein
VRVSVQATAFSALLVVRFPPLVLRLSLMLLVVLLLKAPHPLTCVNIPVTVRVKYIHQLCDVVLRETILSVCANPDE